MTSDAAESNRSLSPLASADDGAGGGAGVPSPLFSTNDLWLEILGVTNSQAYLRLHNTVYGETYQLLSKTSLTPGAMNWTPGQIVIPFTNQIDFSPVDASPPNQFFRAQQSDNIVVIQADGDAFRPSPGFSAVDGGFQIYFQPNNSITNVTIYYQLSGSAINGVDYTTLPSSTVLPAPSGYTNLTVQPLQDFTPKFQENLVITLVPTNGYLVEPGNSSASITIFEQSSNSVLQLVTNVDSPAGMAYHPLSNSLIVSYHSDEDGAGGNFVRIDTNGTVTPWTGISGLVNEINLGIVQTNANGFTVGDMYYGTGTNGVIAWLSANGTVSNLDWLTLPGETNTLRGSLYVDQTGIFSNDLIVVTGDYTGNDGGDVWRVTSETNATFLTNIDNFHMEGLVTLPNNTNLYGPWAGKILTGYARGATLFTVDTNSNITPFQLGIQCEDINIIPSNQDFYFGDEGNNAVFKLPRSLLTNYVGDLLITQEGAIDGEDPAMLFIVHWDPGTTNFLLHTIPPPSSFSTNADFEQGTFAPMNIPATSVPY